MTIRAYECGIRDHPGATVIHHTSRGRAKAEFLADLDMPEFVFTDVRCRVIGRPVQTDAFRHMAESRAIPFAHVGMKVQVGDRFGRIIGHNSASNLDVLFEDGRHSMNCHPNWDITYYDEAGSVLASYPGHAG